MAQSTRDRSRSRSRPKINDDIDLSFNRLLSRNKISKDLESIYYQAYLKEKAKYTSFWPFDMYVEHQERKRKSIEYLFQEAALPIYLVMILIIIFNIPIHIMLSKNIWKHICELVKISYNVRNKHADLQGFIFEI